MFTHMNTWMNGNNLMTLYYLKKKKGFYSYLKIKGITGADSMHIKRVCKDFELKLLKYIMIFMFRTIHYC